VACLLFVAAALQAGIKMKWPHHYEIKRKNILSTDQHRHSSAENVVLETGSVSITSVNMGSCHILYAT
jgi:hypothetical protein